MGDFPANHVDTRGYSLLDVSNLQEWVKLKCRCELCWLFSISMVKPIDNLLVPPDYLFRASKTPRHRKNSKILFSKGWNPVCWAFFLMGMGISKVEAMGLKRAPLKGPKSKVPGGRSKSAASQMFHGEPLKAEVHRARNVSKLLQQKWTPKQCYFRKMRNDTFPKKPNTSD